MKALTQMTKITRWFPVLLALIIFWACEEKDNMDPVGGWDISAPAPATPGPDATVELDETVPDAPINFQWNPATTTNRFGVAYTFLLMPEGSTNYEDALMQITPGNAGRESFVAPTAAEVDYALWAACYPAGSTVDLEWVVIARAIEKEAVARQGVSITRFDTEITPSTLYVYGSGAEAGEDPSNATPMRSFVDADGNPTGVFEVYTTLSGGGTFYFSDRADAEARAYGGADGALEPCGPAITAPETGQYRVTVNLNDNTYDLLHIDRWSLVGDAVEGGWGGDVPLTYKGNGVWESDLEFYQPYEGAGFAFRANGDWGYLLKRVAGTATDDNKGGELIMESEGNATGVAFEDIPGTLGLHTVTLDLGTYPYTYTLVEKDQEGPTQAIIGESSNPDGDAVSGSFDVADIETPDAVYLISEGEVISEFAKNGDVFSSENYLALEANKTYTLNTASDGSGTEIVAGTISVARDQAYLINIDFGTGKLSWKYYNMKLFHWDEEGGGWETRQETLMTYIHPYTFEVTAPLTAGFHSKFNSPWEVQFGTDSKALSGTMTNTDGGPNFTGIVATGTYKATIVVSEDYSTAEYTFVKQ